MTLDERGRASYTLVTPGGRAGAARRAGRHQVGNTLAAAAVALEAGMPLAELAAALGELGWSRPAGWTSSTGPTA